MLAACGWRESPTGPTSDLFVLDSTFSLLATKAEVAADPFPVGKGVIEVDFEGTPLVLHYYKPANYTGERFILLFHGASRTASGYRDNASGMADAFQSLVVVPEFDLERFPSESSQ